MWYVMQVKTGKEEKTVLMIEQHTAGKCSGNCFIPKFERKKKYAGIWNLEQRILFPGYVFVDTDEIEAFYLALKNVPELTKVLGNGELWTAVDKADLQILHRLLDKEHLVRMSQGIILGRQIVIQNGPLKGMEAVIRKVDRHRRTAVVELQMFGRLQEAEVGVELLRSEETVK